MEEADVPAVVLLLKDGGLKPLHGSGYAGRVLDGAAIDVGDPGDLGFAVAGDVDLRVVDGPDEDITLLLELPDVVEDGVAGVLVASVEGVEAGSDGLVEEVVVVLGGSNVHVLHGADDVGDLRGRVRAGLVPGVCGCGEDQKKSGEGQE